MGAPVGRPSGARLPYSSTYCTVDTPALFFPARLGPYARVAYSTGRPAGRLWSARQNLRTGRHFQAPRFVQPNSTPFPDSFLFWYGPSFYRYLKLKSSLESLQQELANTVDIRKRFALFKKWLAKQNTVFFWNSNFHSILTRISP